MAENKNKTIDENYNEPLTIQENVLQPPSELAFLFIKEFKKDPNFFDLMEAKLKKSDDTYVTYLITKLQAKIWIILKEYEGKDVPTDVAANLLRSFIK